VDYETRERIMKGMGKECKGGRRKQCEGMELKGEG